MNALVPLTLAVAAPVPVIGAAAATVAVIYVVGKVLVSAIYALRDEPMELEVGIGVRVRVKI